jgi:hypothetical protein
MKLNIKKRMKHFLNNTDKNQMKMTAFWDIAQCSLVEVDQHY